MSKLLVMGDFWKIINKFPDIRGLSDLTDLITSMETTAVPEAFPLGYKFLKAYESSMRSHIYAEWHAQEYLDDSETA